MAEWTKAAACRAVGFRPHGGSNPPLPTKDVTLLSVSTEPTIPDPWPREWLKRRNLAQYKNLPDEEFVRRMIAKDKRAQGAGEAPDEQRNRAITRPELGLPEDLRPLFKREVQKVLDAVGTEGNADLLRPLVEDFVFLMFLFRDAAIRMRQSGDYNDKDVRALDLLMSRRVTMLAEFEQTPKGLRLGNRKTQSTIDEAIRKSTVSATTVKQKMQDLEAEERRIFDKPDETPQSS